MLGLDAAACCCVVTIRVVLPLLTWGQQLLHVPPAAPPPSSLPGHETTAAVLTWALFCVVQNPEVEARLLAEIDAAVGDRTPGETSVLVTTSTKQPCNLHSLSCISRGFVVPLHGSSSTHHHSDHHPYGPGSKSIRILME
jgi:hypothetical protein